MDYEKDQEFCTFLVKFRRKDVLNELRLRLLETIADHDGDYGWYQLDRAVSSTGVVINERLLDVLRELEGNGFLTSASNGSKKDPVYRITEAGRKVISNRSERGQVHTSPPNA
jgi:DNA-binding PadR family transcriptional regulator